jgi:site-specific DNA recombinase
MQHLRVALYARVSSGQQVTDSTIASQLAALNARLVQDGVRALPEHRFVDDGHSGNTLLRPALERLRDAVATGLVDRLYVHSPDRLARRYAYQVVLMEEFRRAGTEVVFLNRPIGASAEDDLLLQVQGMVAEYERAKILERSRRGKRHAAQQGSVSALSCAPYGYRYVSKRDGGGIARYEIVEEEAQVVRLVFKWVGHDRLSAGAVSRRLHEAGYLTRHGATTWSRSTIWAMLRNPAYIGSAAFGRRRVAPPATTPRLRAPRGGSEHRRQPYRVEQRPPEHWIAIPVPAIVDADLFEVVQDQLAENQRLSRARTRGERYLLQGLLVCRECGYAYYAKPINRQLLSTGRPAYAYYRCLGNDGYRFGGQRLCRNRQVRMDWLDEVVWREVARFLEQPERIEAEYHRRLQSVQDAGPGQQTVAAIDGRLAALRRGMGRLIDSYTDGVIEKEDFEPRMAGFRQRIRSLEEQRKAAVDTADLRATLSVIVGQLEAFSQAIRDRLDDVDWTTRRHLIRLLVKRIEVAEHDINIVFRVPPDPQSPRPQRSSNRILQHCPHGSDPADSVSPAAAPDRGAGRLPAQADGAGSAGAGPHHIEPAGRDTGGSFSSGERTGAPAGRQHRGDAERAGRMAGREAWNQASPGLEEAAPGHRCQNWHDRRLDPDQQGGRRCR